MTAAQAARAESERWMEVARLAATVDREPPPTEVAVTGFDPSDDLGRRAGRWGHRFPDTDLGEVCRFAAALAVAEAEAWESDDPTVATRAYEERRFLAADRIQPWAIPWADATGEWTVRDVLLEVGERLRLAPDLVGREGLVLPGEDSFGPLEPDRPDGEWLRSLLSGTVLVGAARRILPAGTDLAVRYAEAARRWEELATKWPGTAAWWSELAGRARRTARRMQGGGIPGSGEPGP